MASRTNRNSQISNIFAGWIHVKTSNADYKKLFGQLKGKEIRLFTNENKAKTAGNGQPDTIVSLSDVASIEKVLTQRAINKQAAFPSIVITYNRAVGKSDVRIRSLTAGDQDKWFLYLQAVGLLKIPEDTSNYLPGQIQELRDIINEHQQKEVEGMYLELDNHDPASPISPISPIMPSAPSNAFSNNNSSFNKQLMDQLKKNFREPSQVQIPTKPPPPVPLGVRTDQPSWLFDSTDVSRLEAESILKENVQFGNLLVRRRPKTKNELWEFAVSIKISDPDKENEYKHFLVKEVTKDGANSSEFIINLGGKGHPPLYSLEDVVGHFVDQSQSGYVPLTGTCNTYDDTIASAPPTGGNPVVDRSLKRKTLNQPNYQNHGHGKEYYNVSQDIQQETPAHGASKASGRRQNYDLHMLGDHSSSQANSVPRLPEEPGYQDFS